MGCLDDVLDQEGTEGKALYLHAQEGAVSLYTKYGFVASGEPFDECGILHSHMERPHLSAASLGGPFAALLDVAVGVALVTFSGCRFCLAPARRRDRVFA